MSQIVLKKTDTPDPSSSGRMGLYITLAGLARLVDSMGATFPLAGQDGKNPEFSKSATHLQYRLEGDVDWIDVIPLSELTGPVGAGVPAGGLAGQILKKINETDFNTEWSDANLGDATTSASTTILQFNNLFGKFLEDRVQSGIENYTLAETGNQLGATIYQRFQSDGASAINFSADFDFLYGIESGAILPEGIYEFYFLFKNNGKVTVNVPNGGAGNTSSEPPLIMEFVVWTNLVNAVVDGNDLNKSGGVSGTWDASAHSVRQIQTGENVILEWEIVGETDMYQIAVGLNSSNVNPSFDDIDFAIATTRNATNTIATVFESGTAKGSNFAINHVIGDKFGVKIEGGVISYLYNGTTVYTSLITPSYPLFVDCSLRRTLSTVRNAKIIEI